MNKISLPIKKFLTPSAPSDKNCHQIKVLLLYRHFLKQIPSLFTRRIEKIAKIEVDHSIHFPIKLSTAKKKNCFFNETYRNCPTPHQLLFCLTESNFFFLQKSEFRDYIRHKYWIGALNLKNLEFSFLTYRKSLENNKPFDNIYFHSNF